MKQLIILSGKGGTGKTTLTAAFAHLASEGEFSHSLTLVDADVDASNLELILKPRTFETTPFMGGQTAIIDQDTCAACGTCQDICRFDAIEWSDDQFKVDPLACEGCAACMFHCSMDSISMKETLAGESYISQTAAGPLFHAHLYPGQENSGKLVSEVRQEARFHALEANHKLLLIDGPPGIGCPVISAITGADLALITTEPTAAGAHDLNRALDTTRHFGIKALVCINKADLYPAGAEIIQEACKQLGVDVIGEIPYDTAVADALMQGKAITAHQPESAASKAIQEIWRILSIHLTSDMGKILWMNQ